MRQTQAKALQSTDTHTHTQTEKHQGQITTQLAATQHAPANVSKHTPMHERERESACVRARVCACVPLFDK